MRRIDILENKTLKLKNVLWYRLDFASENIKLLDNEIEKMTTLIRVHDAKQIGPLMYYSNTSLDEKGDLDINVKLMIQSDRYIDGNLEPYQLEPIMIVRKCLFAHYVGPEDKLMLVYNKMEIYAFEHDMELNGDNYTIYVNREDEGEIVIVDVFMPLKEKP